jgi:hypothetical protein
MIVSNINFAPSDPTPGPARHVLLFNNPHLIIRSEKLIEFCINMKESNVVREILYAGSGLGSAPMCEFGVDRKVKGRERVRNHEGCECVEALRVRLGVHAQAMKVKTGTGNACPSTEQHAPFYYLHKKQRGRAGSRRVTRRKEVK